MVGKLSAFSCAYRRTTDLQINEKHPYNIEDWKDDKGSCQAAAMSTNGIVFVLNHSRIVHRSFWVILMYISIMDDLFI